MRTTVRTKVYSKAWAASYPSGAHAWATEITGVCDVTRTAAGYFLPLDESELDPLFSAEVEPELPALSDLFPESDLLSDAGCRRPVATGGAAFRRLLRIIGDVPARALELHRRSGQQLFQFAAAMRTHGQGRVGKFLDPLGQAMTLFTLIFVERHDSPQLF